MIKPTNVAQAVAAMELVHYTYGPLETMMTRSALVQVAPIICEQVKMKVDKKDFEHNKVTNELVMMMEGLNNPGRFFIEFFVAIQHAFNRIASGQKREVVLNEVSVLVQKIIQQTGKISNYKQIPITQVYETLDAGIPA